MKIKKEKAECIDCKNIYWIIYGCPKCGCTGFNQVRPSNVQDTKETTKGETQ